MSVIDNNTGTKPLQEINRYHDRLFPVGLYIVTKTSIYPEGRGYMDLHWHEELQFTRVVKGSIGMKVNGTSYTLHEGESIFINKDALHITDYMTDDAEYLSLDVPEKLLGFFSMSRMEQNYVQSYTDDYFFSACVFTGEQEWEQRFNEMLGSIQQSFLDADKPAFWEYEVSTRIVSMWLLMIRNINRDRQSSIISQSAVKKQHRMQKMLAFVHSNYMHRILVSDIADAGMVSEAECNRCFRDVVHESPSRYLLQYRYLRARELLLYSDLSITEVALAVGFNDTSYFIQYFRKQTGQTPKAFRGKSRQ